MMDLKPPQNASNSGKNGGNSSDLHYLEELSEAELLDLRSKIDKLLPVRALKDMSLEEELVLQYRQVKALQSEVVNNDGVEPNKKAQVVNSCGAALDNLIKMQERYHHSERLKQIELYLIECLNAMPEEYTRTFFERYELLGVKT